MDNYSILDPSTSGHPTGLPLPSSEEKGNSASGPTAPREPLRFPVDGSGQSLAEMAQRDLEATLQLLAERAQYITGASGAAIALRDGREMICCASAGPTAPQLGTQLQINSGLTGESVRTREVLRCDDAERDSRVNRESCRALGIRSVMAMPLIRAQEVIGVFELLADRTSAFEERDVTALERLAEMILTALEHADASKRALKEIAAKSDEILLGERKIEPLSAAAIPAQEASAIALPQLTSQDTPVGEAKESQSVPSTKLDNIRRCEACGFPVSEGRTLCLDCEAARDSAEHSAASSENPAFLSQFGAGAREESWFQSHMYTIGTLLVVALTVVLLVLKLR